jgi:hypothetical protein
MAITISFVHNSTTTTQTVTPASTQRVADYLASLTGGGEAYFTAVAGRLIDEANQWAAQQAANTAAQGVAPVLPTWAAELWMAAGTQWRHNSQTWRARQAHRSQAGWEPPNVPALFELVPAAAGIWAAGVSYAPPTEVTHLGIRYRCLQSHTSQVGWEPPNVPALWAVV